MGYPSLQGSMEFDRVEDVVPVLDEMVLRLKFTQNALLVAVMVLEQLPVKRRGRLSRDRLIADLQCEADKTEDSLSVYGFRAAILTAPPAPPPPPSRRGS